MMGLARIAFLGLAVCVSAQVPIPKKEVGFVYNSGSPTAKVHFDLYIDQLCGDSLKAWPVIVQVADHYGPSDLQLTTHLFALPYLRNGFMASKGAHIMEKEMGTNKTGEWITKVYDNFDSLKVSATTAMSDQEILEKFADIALELGIQKSRFKSLYGNSEIEAVARVEFKYACTRGVAAVPTFMLNDVVVDATENWTFDQWNALIDPLVGIKSSS